MEEPFCKFMFKKWHQKLIPTIFKNFKRLFAVRYNAFRSRTIAPEKNYPPPHLFLILTITLNVTLTGG